MFILLRKLFNIGLLTPAGLIGLVRAVFSEGINLMTLLNVAARLNKDNSVLADEKEELSFRDLYQQSQRLAAVLQNDYKVQPRQKIAVICRNHAALIKSIFAASRLGADVYLLNVEMSPAQFVSLHEKYNFDLIIYDEEAAALLKHLPREKLLSTYNNDLPSIQSLTKPETARFPALKRIYSSNLIILTGGTTGQPKLARRKPSISNFLNPFFALLTELNLDEYKSVYIATPVYHGFGVSAVMMALILGNKMYLTSRFEAQKACDLIRQNQIEAVTLVPLMLQRMLGHNAAQLASLQRIISGGAPLSPALAEETLAKLGDKLFNLYGTSEAGFSVMATPVDLRGDSRTIGKPIRGVRLKVLDAANRETKAKEIGRICISSKWTMNNGADGLIEMGDVGYRDDGGLLFLCGRVDEMIVSGGENVYPIELENVLVKHPHVKQVAVIGMPDAEFGQRLKAFIVPADDAEITEMQILDWLKERVARFQMPAKIEFLTDIPVTSVGKPNKKLLS